MNREVEISKLKLNDVVPTKEILGEHIGGVCGENLKLVGITYVFETTTNLKMDVKVWAEGFDPEKFD